MTKDIQSAVGSAPDANLAIQEFHIAGIPKAQGRVRFARVGKFVKAYDPAESREHKENLRAQIAACRPAYWPNGPIALTVSFELPRPQSHYTKKGLRPLAPPYCYVKPDASNMLKLVEDACNGLLWRDDAQVVKVECIKVYADGPPQTNIRVERIEK